MVRPSVDPITRAGVITQLMGFDDNSTIRVVPIKFSDGTAGLGITYYPKLDPKSPSFYEITNLLTVTEGQDLRIKDFDVILRVCEVASLGPLWFALEQMEDVLLESHLESESTND